MGGAWVFSSVSEKKKTQPEPSMDSQSDGEGASPEPRPAAPSEEDDARVVGASRGRTRASGGASARVSGEGNKDGASGGFVVSAKRPRGGQGHRSPGTRPLT